MHPLPHDTDRDLERLIRDLLEQMEARGRTAAHRDPTGPRHGARSRIGRRDPPGRPRSLEGASVRPAGHRPSQPPSATPPAPDHGAEARSDPPVATIHLDAVTHEAIVVVEPVRGLLLEGLQVEAAGERLHLEAPTTGGLLREEIVLPVAVDDERLEVRYHDDVILVKAPLA